MFSKTTQHLTIQSPSSTTVCYSVSNASSSVTGSSRVLSYLQGSLRVLICVCVLLVDVATAEVNFARRFWATSIRFGLVENAARNIAGVLDWRVTAGLSLIVVYLCMRRSHTGAAIQAFEHIQEGADILLEESLLVLQGLGIQTSTSSPYLFSTSTTTFIPTTQIQDIVIHEAFKGLEVRFYLAVIVEDATEAVVVFPVRIHLTVMCAFSC